MTQTIEQTGKKWKAVIAIGSIACVVGLVLMFQDKPSAGAGVAVCGLVVLIVGKAGAWWHHG